MPSKGDVGGGKTNMRLGPLIVERNALLIEMARRIKLNNEIKMKITGPNSLYIQCLRHDRENGGHNS
jgi:hypothetical protein